jgi:folate-binding protein YgfZ
MNQGYRALRESAAWLDLSERGRIRMTGEDRARLLHAMVSNRIEGLAPGQGCYAFFLNAQGRILADVNVLALADAFLLDTEPETRALVYEHLDRHIIADDVTLEDITAATAEIGIEGPHATGVLAKMGAPQPREPYSNERWGERIVLRASSTGAPGFALFAPLDEKRELIRRIEAAGAVAAGADDARVVRLEMGKPRYGEDFSDKHLPHETQLLHAVNFNKGCYLGQEIVERVRSRGAVHRFLVRLAIDAKEPPAPGTKIEAGGKEVGEVMSAAYSPAEGKVLAFAYVREPGAELIVAGAAARQIR